jgi:glycosyltransferase involved in cell wall biosynthesis
VITVLTPTYQRAHTLRRVYESLLRQNRGGFEWLVVDDGSRDGTRQLVAGLAAEAPFAVRYLHKANGGRHSALNLGFSQAEGEFVTVMDSDDWFEDDALAAFTAAWESIPPAERGRFAAVAGLCATPEGTLIGTRYPADPLDADFVSLRVRHRVAGDKKELFRTEVVRQLPFPEIQGERRVPFSHLLVRLSRSWRVRFFNRVVARKDYRADGLTASIDRVRMRSPRGSRAGYLEWMHPGNRVPPRAALRHYANYVRYSLHARVPLLQQAREAPSAALYLASMPAGVALTLRDRLRFGAATPVSASE